VERMRTFVEEHSRCRTGRRVALLAALQDLSRPLIGQSHPLRAMLRNGVLGQHRDLSELACVD
jgi:hypothetical protein